MGTASDSAILPTTRDNRWRKLGTGSAALLLGRIITAACGLVQLPIVLAHLGATAFGLWIALLGLLWSLSILDCGLGFAIQNRLTVLAAEKRRAEAAALVRFALRWLTGGALLLLAVTAPLVLCGRWADWFGVQDNALRSSMPAAVAIVLVAASCNLPLALAARLATALQELWLIGLTTVGASLLGLLAVIVAARLGFSLPGLVLAGCVLPLAPSAGIWLLLRRRHPWLFESGTGALPDIRGLWQESGLFLAPQIGAAFITSFVPTLVAIFAGPAEIAAFAVLQRIYGLMLQLHSLATMPTWPAYTQAAALSDAAFARRTFRASWIVTVSGFALPTLLLTPWLPAVVRLWFGPHAPQITTALLWSLACWHLLQFGGQTIAMVLNGVGRIGSLALLSWLCIAIALGLCAVLGPRWGAVGVVVALGLPYLLINLPVTGWQARRVLRNLGANRESSGKTSTA